jgi:peptidoglycan/xylan/chitin deacetylase (PgdA/CDA1 family)
MSRSTIVALCALAALACGGSKTRSGTESGEIAAPAAPTGIAAPAGGARTPNELGRIPVLEYHVIGGEKNALYTRTRASFRQDLEEAYRRGYRPITIAQLLDRDFRDVPAGMSPVVFVFDDASPEQFAYVERDGKLTVDPQSAVGIWLDFAKSHPGWKNRATFCMLNGGAAGHNFFGDNPKFMGQQKAWRFQKVKWLADQGFELCAHTLWHAMLNKYSDAVVQEQIARNVMGIDSVIPGYKVRTFALPYGIWPKNRPLAWQGQWTDPKTGQTHAYKFDAVLEVSGGPARSPYDPQFNPHSITRIEAIGDDIRKTLDRLDQTASRFVTGAETASAKGGR